MSYEPKQDNYVKIQLDVDVLRTSPVYSLRCHLTVENICDENVVLYDDPSLPTVLYEPGGQANVFYGLTRMPDFRDYYAPERFCWRVLQPGQLHLYRFELADPLKENSHYGNITYEDPKSKYYGTKPANLSWRQLKVRVGYLPFEPPAFVERLHRTYEGLSEGITVVVDGTRYRPLDLQREISLEVRVKE